MRGIKRHRQDQRPCHQRYEGRKNPVAQYHEDDGQPGPDEDIQQPPGQTLFEVEIGLIGRIHGSAPLNFGYLNRLPVPRTDRPPALMSFLALNQ